MNFKETILQQAIQLFMKNGFAQYDEQQLAKALDISQATFQDFFKDKDDLVMQALEFQTEWDRKRHEKMVANAENAVEELMLIVKDGLETLKNTNPQYYADLMHNARAWKYVTGLLESYSYPTMHKLLNKGVQQGVFLKDINIGIVTRVIIENINVLFNAKVFPPEKFSMREVYKSIYLYYIRGLCTVEAMTSAEKIFARTLAI